MDETRNKKLYVAITKTTTRLSKAIRIFTRYPYAHSSVSHYEDLRQMYSFARQNPPHCFPCGFIVENAFEGLLGTCDTIPCKVFSISVTEEQYDMFCDIIEEFVTNKQIYKYNLVGFATMILHMPIRRRNKYMCSQFVAYALTKCGAIKFKKDYSLIRPQDFDKMSQFELVFQGDLKDYSKQKTLELVS